MVGLSVAATIVLGFMIYPLFPAPLVKLVLLAPFLSLTMAIPLLFYRRPDTILYVAVSLAAILMFFSLFMGAAILLAGVSAYLFSRFVIRGCDSKAKVIISAASFPSFGFISALAIIYYLLDIPFIQTLSWGTGLLLFAATTVLAVLGAHASVVMFSRRFTAMRN